MLFAIASMTLWYNFDRGFATGFFVYGYTNVSEHRLCIYGFMYFIHRFVNLCTKNLCIYVFGIAPTLTLTLTLTLMFPTPTLSLEKRYSIEWKEQPSECLIRE